MCIEACLFTKTHVNLDEIDKGFEGAAESIRRGDIPEVKRLRSLDAPLNVVVTSLKQAKRRSRCRKVMGSAISTAMIRSAQLPLSEMRRRYSKGANNFRNAAIETCCDCCTKIRELCADGGGQATVPAERLLAAWLKAMNNVDPWLFAPYLEFLTISIFFAPAAEDKLVEAIKEALKKTRGYFAGGKDGPAIRATVSLVRDVLAGLAGTCPQKALGLSDEAVKAIFYAAAKAPDKRDAERLAEALGAFITNMNGARLTPSERKEYRKRRKAWLAQLVEARPKKKAVQWASVLQLLEDRI